MKYAVPLTFALVLVLIPAVRAEDKKDVDPLADKVRKAIDGGVKFLRDNQDKSGDWERDLIFKDGRFGGGQTALALLALLNAGIPVDDPLIKNGLDSLRKMQPTSTYVVALQTMVYAQAGKSEDKERIQKNVDWLLDTRMPKGWTYTREESKAGNRPDNSNTQYALLGLAEGRRAGATVDAAVMKEIQQMYLDMQNKETGSWAYGAREGGGRFTMTTAGVCGLLITGMNQDQEHKDLAADGSDKHCGEYKDNEPVKKGLAWLAARFPNRLEPSKLINQGLIPPFYCLYGLERCGRLSGQRFLGDKDWYRIGCQYLVEMQNADGSWKGGVLTQEVPGEVSQIVSTSFALLFLSKGRTPVLWTKFAWGKSEELGWNRKHNDARNVTDFASRELFKNQPLAWQVFDVRDFDAPSKESRLKLSEELLQSPIVFLSGHSLKLDEKQTDVLREYMANGGFLFAEACCNSPQFDIDFKKLMKDLYGPDAKLDPLPPGHALWTARYPLVPREPFELLGYQQGCKTVVIYSPQAISGYWEANLYADKGRGTKAFQVAGNVIAYATGLEPPKPKGYEVPITRDSKHEAQERGYLKVAQLRYKPAVGHEWQPAPKAMRNLMEECHKVGIDVVPDTRAIDPSDKNIVEYPFLYMHGRTAFEIPKDLESLRFRLEGNGLLFADACCGNKDFDASFRKLIAALWPGKELEPLSPSDELYGKELNGVAINEVRCRREEPGGKPQAEFHKVAPALEGIKIKGRWVVIYSKYDIGCALENSKASDCLGHDHDSAVLLARAAVLYALKR